MTNKKIEHFPTKFLLHKEISDEANSLTEETESDKIQIKYNQISI